MKKRTYYNNVDTPETITQNKLQLAKEEELTADKLRKESEVTSKSIGYGAKLGVNKGVDWTMSGVKLLLSGILPEGDERTLPKPIYNIKEGINSQLDNWINQSKEEVSKLRKEREIFYLENDKDINFVTKMASGAVESLTNPVEVAAQVGLGAITKPLSLLTRFGVEALYDVSQAEVEAKRYEDRDITLQEAGEVAGTSLLANTIFLGLGNAVADYRNSKSALVESLQQSGDETVNVRQQINDFDNIGKDVKSKDQQMFTDYNTNVKLDIQSDPYKYTTGKNTSYKGFYEKLDEVVGVYGADSNFDIENPSTFYGNYQYNQSSYDWSYTGKGLDTPNTVLGRQVKFFKDGDELIKSNPVFVEVMRDYGYNPNRSEVQNISSIAKKENPILENFAENVKPTIDDYVTRWETKKSKFDARGGKTVTGGSRFRPPVIDKTQIDSALNKIDADFNIQRIYVQNEYLNKANVNGKFKSFNDVVKVVGADSVEISRQIIDNGIEGAKNLDKMYGTGDFFESSLRDSILLDELDMKVSLYDISDFENFSKKYGYAFDEDMNIKYDGSALEALSKKNTTPDEADIIDRALQSNPDQYVSFIINSKEVLDNMNESTEFFKPYEDFFGVSARKLKSLIKNNKEFIEKAYNNLTSDVPKIDGMSLKDWKEKIVENIALKKKNNAIQTIQISNNINKQNMLGDFDKYYNTKINKENVGIVELKPDMEKAFNDNIKPYFDNGIMKKVEGEPIHRTFARFVSDLKKTRRSAKWIGEYKTVGELREYFVDGKFGQFFTTGYNERFLKPAGINIRDIVDYQSNKVARFTQFGSTSPYVLKNRFEYDITRAVSEMYGKELSSAQLDVVNKAIKPRARNMIENTQLGKVSELDTVGSVLSRGTRSVVRNWLMPFTGAAEIVVQTYPMSFMRAQKFGGVGVYVQTPIFQFKRAIRKLKSDSNISKYTLGQLKKRVDLEKYNADSSLAKGWGMWNDIAFKAQQVSDATLKYFGEAQTTNILYNMGDYNSLDNELRDVLRMNGIDESNFEVFRDFTKNHIDKNDLYVNVDELSVVSNKLDDTISTQTDIDMAQALRSVYYQVSDYIGNINYNSKMYNKTQNEFNEWYNMFRTFSRNLNMDTLHRMFNYTNYDGVAKNRISRDYIAPKNPNDYVQTSIGVIPKQMYKDSGLLFTYMIAGTVAGYGYTLAKDIIYSDKTLDQRLSIAQVKLEDLYNQVSTMDTGSQVKLLQGFVETNGLNPLDLLSGSNVAESLSKRAKKIWNTLTDEEKAAFGENETEGYNEFFKFSMELVLGKSIVNNATAINKYISEGDIGSLPDKIYGFDKEQMDRFEYFVRKRNLDNKSWSDFVEGKRKEVKADIDFMENKTDSYDNLPKEAKDMAEIIYNNNKESFDDKTSFKSEFPIIWSDAVNTDRPIDAISDYYIQSKGINVYEDIKDSIKEEEPKPKTKSMNKTQKEYLKKIAFFLGKKQISKSDIELYEREFVNGNIKNGEDLKKKLKDIYNIDYDKFNTLTKQKQIRHSIDMVDFIDE